MFFFGCSRIIYTELAGNFEYERDKLFLQSLFNENEEIKSLGIRLLPNEVSGKKSKPPAPSFIIEARYFWEKDADTDLIIISRTPVIPREDSLAGRTNTSLASCLEGDEVLIILEELEPPFVALRVDNLAIGDPDYPLIRMGGINITAQNDKKRLVKKMHRIKEIIEAAENPLVSYTPQPFWITAGGDMMLGRGATEVLQREGAKGLFGGTAELILSSHLAMATLEGVISNRGERVPKSFNFRFSPAVAPMLKAAGFDVLLHANNHVFDYGETAFLDSLNYLKDAGIGAAGAGIDIDAASTPFEMQWENKTVRVFGLASFPRENNGWDGVNAAALENRAGMLHAGRQGAEMIKQKMNNYKEPSFNIILFHGGAEWSNRPDNNTRQLYTDLIRNGADLIIGSHPHIVQGFEWVDGKPVFWSLGNFVFSGMQNTGGGDEGLFVRLGFWEGKLLYLEPFALAVSNPKVSITPPEKLGTFYTRSRQLRQISQ
ncbi:MAG: CapA family protein [Treponema sp.]|nr:CapA family protein [Treponema sp.]